MIVQLILIRQDVRRIPDVNGGESYALRIKKSGDTHFIQPFSLLGQRGGRFLTAIIDFITTDVCFISNIMVISSKVLWDDGP